MVIRGGGGGGGGEGRGGRRETEIKAVGTFIVRGLLGQVPHFVIAVGAAAYQARRILGGVATVPVQTEELQQQSVIN